MTQQNAAEGKSDDTPTSNNSRSNFSKCTCRLRCREKNEKNLHDTSVPTVPIPNPSLIKAAIKKQRPAIKFRICNKFPRQDVFNTEWFIMLYVYTKDVPRMMRDGFFWSPANCFPELGSVVEDFILEPSLGSRGHVAMRQYVLADLSSERLWIAILDVITMPRRLDILMQVKLSDIKPSMVRRVEAWNDRGWLIYNYTTQNPKENFNILYENMPLSGWWPWPKKASSTTALKFTDAATRAFFWADNSEASELEDGSDFILTRKGRTALFLTITWIAMVTMTLMVFYALIRVLIFMD